MMKSEFKNRVKEIWLNCTDRYEEHFGMTFYNYLKKHYPSLLTGLPGDPYQTIAALVNKFQRDFPKD